MCVPTTSGTGSETTRTAILTRADHAKVWLWGDEIKADEVVLDPELTVSLPPTIDRGDRHRRLGSCGRGGDQPQRQSGRRPLRPRGDPPRCRLSRRRGGKSGRSRPPAPALQWAAAFAGVAIDNCGTGDRPRARPCDGLAAADPHGRAVGIAMLASMPGTSRVTRAFAACAVAMGAEPSARSFCLAYENLVRAIGMKVELADEFPAYRRRHWPPRRRGRKTPRCAPRTAAPPRTTICCRSPAASCRSRSHPSPACGRRSCEA